jgi:plastocyanin
MAASGERNVMSNGAGRNAGAGAVLGVTVLLIGACGAKGASSGDSSAVASGSTSTASASATATAQLRAITIEGFRYVVATTVPPGAQITVINKDSAEHTVTADSGGAFHTEVQANSQATFTAPTLPGAYPFHCAYHPNMRGQLVVVQLE